MSTGSCANLVRVCGMKRSGNHAIINWMLAQEPSHEFKNDSQVTHGVERDVGSGEVKLSVVSFEEKHPSAVFDDTEVRNYHRNYGVEVEDFRHVQILRDPFNWVVSRASMPHEDPLDGVANPVTRYSLMALWVEHARCYLRHAQADGNKVAVSYNRWLVDGGYRAQVCAELGLEMADASDVENTGSFFDSVDEGSLLGRWRLEGYGHLVEAAASNREMVALAEEIFGRHAVEEVVCGLDKV